MWIHLGLLMTVIFGVHGANFQARRFKKIGLPSAADLLNYVFSGTSDTAIQCSKFCVDREGCKSFAITTVGECFLYTVAYTVGSNGDVNTLYYIRQGEDITCINVIGFEYNGYLSKTASNTQCLYWNSVATTYPDTSFIDGSVDRAENFCREPTLTDARPWCYTGSTSWEYCSIGFCCLNYNAADYTGNVSRTEQGVVCQRWDSQSPHSHGYFHDSALQNWCRASHDTPGRTWCYTINSSIRWQHCAVKQCGY